jgi:hypothetical protein
MNKIILLTTNPVFEDPRYEHNTYKNGSILSLEIKNTSDQAVLFAGDYDIQIFTKTEKGWVKVLNNNEYGSSSTWVPSGKPHPSSEFITLYPSIPFLSSSTTIRVVVIGRLRDTSGEQVGAYLDLPLNP